MTSDDTPEIDEIDGDMLLLLDRIKERMPEINLDDHQVSWHQMPDGAPALLVDGGGFAAMTESRSRTLAMTSTRSDRSRRCARSGRS